MWGPDIFGLCPVDLVAKDPAAGRTVGIETPTAVIAFTALGNAGNEDMVSWFEGRDTGAN